MNSSDLMVFSSSVTEISKKRVVRKVSLEKIWDSAGKEEERAFQAGKTVCIK